MCCGVTSQNYVKLIVHDVFSGQQTLQIAIPTTTAQISPSNENASKVK